MFLNFVLGQGISVNCDVLRLDSTSGEQVKTGQSGYLLKVGTAETRVATRLLT